MPRLAHDHPAARQPLGDVIVGIPGQVEGHAVGEEGAEALPGNPGQADADSIIGQAGVTKTPRHFAR